MSSDLGKLVQTLRKYRKLHKWIGWSLVLFICISSLTGIALAFKKDFDLLQPPTLHGSQAGLENALQLDSIHTLAQQHFLEAKGIDNDIDRLDIRPSKGIVKVLFESGYWELQMDLHTGKMLSLHRRHSDWIEALHDGSIIHNLFKKISMTYLSLGLLFLVFSGLWLFYGPKMVRSRRKKIE